MVIRRESVACDLQIANVTVDGPTPFTPAVDGIASLEKFLADSFPPCVQIPSAALCRKHRGWLAYEAREYPGDTVKPGLFPNARIKNARLLLTVAGDV